MWIFAFIVGLASLVGIYTVSSHVRTVPVAEVRSQDLAANMAIYRSAVIRYARSNPSYEGIASDAVLAFPAWYRAVRNPLWTNMIVNGMVIVYAASATPVPIARDLALLSHHSLLAGWKHASSGTLWTPGNRDTGIALAAEIPDGSPVWVAITR